MSEIARVPVNHGFDYKEIEIMDPCIHHTGHISTGNIAQSFPELARSSMAICVSSQICGKAVQTFGLAHMV